MATAREYFDKESSANLCISNTHRLGTPSKPNALGITASLALNFAARTKYILLYVPDDKLTCPAIAAYLRNPQPVLDLASGIEVQMGFASTDEKIISNDLLFTGRIIAYTPYVFTTAEKTELVALANANKISLILRDGAYAKERDRLEKPLAFISHDSRDKEPFVRELAGKLQKMLCPVWYDEFSLKVGDGLRESIERGLKECQKCVVVLSPNFLSNNGWTKAEFDSVYTREILENKILMLPIWRNVSKQEVFDYSPRLADKVGLPSSNGPEEIARKLVAALNTNI